MNVGKALIAVAAVEDLRLGPS